MTCRCGLNAGADFQHYTMRIGVRQTKHRYHPCFSSSVGRAPDL